MSNALDPRHEPGRVARRIMLRFAIVLPFVFALLLFWPAGTWAWPRGWRFAGTFAIATVIAATYLWRVNPEIYVARGVSHPGAPRWDKILVACLAVALIAVLPVAALDDGRFHWSDVPEWVSGLGYALFLASYALSIWAESVNKFFEPTVRVQSDRGHRVVDTGPYARVRHPGYVAGALLFFGTALALGSWWALIPAAIATAVLTVRTRWEEQLLKAGLPGYQEYTQRVRYRWIPGVW